MAYAAQSDLVTVGLPVSALGQLTGTQISAALQNASDRADAAFRGRYGNAAVPLLQWDTTITLAVAKIATYELMLVRGYNPAAGRDDIFLIRNNEALAYLDRIQRQQAHPLVTLAAVNQPGSQQPLLLSSSVVNLATGRRAPNRGW